MDLKLLGLPSVLIKCTILGIRSTYDRYCSNLSSALNSAQLSSPLTLYSTTYRISTSLRLDSVIFLLSRKAVRRCTSLVISDLPQPLLTTVRCVSNALSAHVLCSDLHSAAKRKRFGFVRFAEEDNKQTYPNGTRANSFASASISPIDAARPCNHQPTTPYVSAASERNFKCEWVPLRPAPDIHRPTDRCVASHATTAHALSSFADRPKATLLFMREGERRG